MIDNNEIEKILTKLENLEDEELAVKLLGEFNRCSSELGRLLLNRDSSLSNEEWEELCKKAKMKLDNIIKTIEHC